MIRQTVTAAGSVIYWPETGSVRGGIVCLHGSEGGSTGWNHLTCALLAANGFVAMAHSYAANRPFFTFSDIDDIALEGTEAALVEMRAEMADHGSGVGLYGLSRGAEQVLLLAQLMAEDGCPGLPDAVAVHSPPDAAWPAFIVADFQTGRPWAGAPNRPAWSWRGAHERPRPGTALPGSGLHHSGHGRRDLGLGSRPPARRAHDGRRPASRGVFLRRRKTPVRPRCPEPRAGAAHRVLRTVPRARRNHRRPWEVRPEGRSPDGRLGSSARLA